MLFLRRSTLRSFPIRHGNLEALCGIKFKT